MYEMIERWKAGGQSRAAFFEEGGFVAVSLSPTQGGEVFARLCLPDGRELRIEQAVSGAYLREVLGC